MYLKDVITAAAEAAKIPIAEVKQIKLSLPPHDFPGGTSGVKSGSTDSPSCHAEVPTAPNGEKNNRELHGAPQQVTAECVGARRSYLQRVDAELEKLYNNCPNFRTICPFPKTLEDPDMVLVEGSPDPLDASASNGQPDTPTADTTAHKEEVLPNTEVPIKYIPNTNNLFFNVSLYSFLSDI